MRPILLLIECSGEPRWRIMALLRWSRKRLALLDDEGHERLDGHAAVVMALMHLSRWDEDGLARLDGLGRLTREIEGQLTLEDVSHERTGMTMYSLASADCDGDLDEQSLVARNRQILLKQNFSFQADL